MLRVIEVAAQIGTVVATASIGFGAFLLSKTLSRVEFSRDLKSSWLQVDNLALSNPEALDALDALLHPEAVDAPLEEKRKRWACYMLNNPLSTAVVGKKSGFMSDAMEAGTEEALSVLVADPMFYRLVQSYAYEPEYKKKCGDLKASYDAHPTEPEAPVDQRSAYRQSR